MSGTRQEAPVIYLVIDKNEHVNYAGINFDAAQSVVVNSPSRETLVIQEWHGTHYVAQWSCKVEFEEDDIR